MIAATTKPALTTPLGAVRLSAFNHPRVEECLACSHLVEVAYHTTGQSADPRLGVVDPPPTDPPLGPSTGPVIQTTMTKRPWSVRTSAARRSSTRLT
jgi:hypothetical protein